jgi:hypothetical protein
MFGLSKEEQKEKKTAETIEKANDVEERKLLFDIETAQQIAESEKTEIEAIWDDEYKMQIGKQWDTTLAPRSREAKKRRPNSQDNFIFPAIYNMHASLTANEPQSIIEPVEPGDKELADKLTGVIAFERYRNKFRTLWKKAVLQGLMYGPFIYQITWDNTWIGGAGPNRWIGEIRHTVIKKEDFFPDPAIRDLEERLQDCSYINIRYRKKMDFFKENFPDKALFVNADEETAEDEGMEPNQATMYAHWHRGLPKYMPDKWAKEFKTKAEEYRANGNTYKAQEYEDKAKGIYKGVHVAFSTKTVMLDYIPYIYDDGNYPIAYRVLYQDEKSPFGLGEIRNVMMPQINHNKADEVELEAMSKEGLGGGYFEKGSMTPAQLDSLMQNSGKGGTWHEVTTLGGLRERTGVKVPASITNYKEHKERMIQTITQNTAIQQGLKPGGVTAYSAIAELGARSDTKNKGKIETMEDLLIDITMMEISRISQFYTEERTFRILGDKAELIKKKAELAQQGIQQAADPTGMMQPMQVPQQIPQQAQQPMPMQQQDSLQQTFSNQEMIKTWEREPGQVEEYIPEFDIRVKVVDERPTDRNYYTNIAMQLVGKFMDVESFWTTIEDGKFPPKEEIMARIKQEQAQQQAIQQQQMMQQQNMARAQMDQQTQLKQQEMALKQQDMQSRQQQQASQLPPEFKGIDSVMNQIGLSDEEKQTVLQGIANMEPKLRYQFLNEDPQVQAETIMKLLGSGK